MTSPINLESKVTVLTTIVLLGIIVVYFYLSKKESFSIAKRFGSECDPQDQDPTDAYLMPKSIVFTINGYNYQETPIIMRDAQKITPLQYAWDNNMMTYFITVYAPNGLCGSEWILETSDYVKPIVTEARSGKIMNVNIERRREGYNHWSLTC